MKTIVLIDDSEADRYILRRTVKRAGLDVSLHEYAGAAEALVDFADERFADRFGTPPAVLVLLDINMPVMNGFEFLERLEVSGVSNESIRVAVVSSSSDPAERARAEEQPHVLDFITKPITPERLARLAKHQAFA